MADKKTTEAIIVEDVFDDDSSVREVEVDGLKFTVDKSKLSSFKFMQLATAEHKAVIKDDGEQIVYASVEMVNYLLGDQVDNILEHLGEDASFRDVYAFYNRILEAVNAKN